MNLHMSISSRRDFLKGVGGGFGLMALGDLLAHEPQPAGHHPAKAKADIQNFCPGGISQVDTLYYKPELAKRNRTPFLPEGQLQFFASKPGHCQGSFLKLRQHGACGRWMSDLFPRLATCVDDMAFVHSMYADSPKIGRAHV